MDEPVPRLVIGGTGPEEAPRHLRQLLDPVGGQRLSAFVGDPPLALGLEEMPEVRVPGELLGPPYRLRFELDDVVTETVVQEPKVPGITCADREPALGQLQRRSRADAPRQGVGPVSDPKSPPIPL